MANPPLQHSHGEVQIISAWNHLAKDVYVRGKNKIGISNIDMNCVLLDNMILNVNFFSAKTLPTSETANNTDLE